jgi:hypothetical protein
MSLSDFRLHLIMPGIGVGGNCGGQSINGKYFCTNISVFPWQSDPHSALSARYRPARYQNLGSRLNGTFSSSSQTKTLSGFPSCSMRTTYPALLIFWFIGQVIRDEGYKWRKSTLCSFLQRLVASSLRSKYPPQHPALKHPHGQDQYYRFYTKNYVSKEDSASFFIQWLTLALSSGSNKFHTLL